ncbi:MAG TPA: chemotaxis protein CheW [Bacteroidales bacterium]|nr:MAG: chemotaxis protein CheW [Bacteroidetes bacterium GWF2_33_38]OFY72976.1 MAG: chemotaxis protein CheW [Bacteroidetes bacterium RIFOXYA12_FULL_33_9]HBF89115.1 chemotaxis protein CheW [Bacteroidales bacterium]
METNSYLSFTLAHETYAAHVINVLNILEMTQITKVPQAPNYMLGVINLRGTVLPVIDTRMKMGIEQTEISKDTCIIVLEINVDNEKIFIGSVVDSVKEVLEIEQQEILPPPNIGNKFKSDFITGMYKKGEGFIMIVNMNNIFSEIELGELVSISN